MSKMYAFIDDLAHSEVRAIAFFPTAIERRVREEIYQQLEAIEGLRIPHVHVRSDYSREEIDYLVERFGTEAFNTHPAGNRYALKVIPPEYARRFFIENVETPPSDDDLRSTGGICPDYSHIEAARLLGMSEYVSIMESQMSRFDIGCAHVSAIRPRQPNKVTGTVDYHYYFEVENFDYLTRYSKFLPKRWLSMELENPLSEQLCAINYINQLILN